MESETQKRQAYHDVCRCCLNEGIHKDITSEYFWMGRLENYEDMLMETFNLTLSYPILEGTNSSNCKICESCILKLRNAAEFKHQVQEAEWTFMQFITPTTLSNNTEVSMKERLDICDDFEAITQENVTEDDDDRTVCEQIIDENWYKNMSMKESLDMCLDVEAIKQENVTDDDGDDVYDSSICEQINDANWYNSRQFENTFANETDEKEKDRIESSKYPSLTLTKLELPEMNIRNAKTENGLKCKNNENNNNSNAPTNIDGQIKSLVCKYCGKTFKKFHWLEKHELTHTKSRKFTDEVQNRKNPDCSKEVFSAMPVLRKHVPSNQKVCDLYSLRTHVEENNCGICKKTFKNGFDLKDHLATHSAKLYKSILCKGFLSKTSFTLKTELKIYSCTICKETFSTEQILNNHVNSHTHNSENRFSFSDLSDNLTNTKPYNCQPCGRGFDHKQSLNHHFKKKHKNKHVKSYKCYDENEVKNASDLHCYICNKWFKSKQRLNNHLNNKHTDKIYTSNDENERSNKNPSENYVDKHTDNITSSHENSFNSVLCDAIRNKEKHSCGICKKQFKHHKRLLVHLKMHSSLTPFECDVRDIQTSLQKRISNHKPHSCHICGKILSSQHYLKFHMNIHTGNKPFKCKICKNRFTSSSALRYHKTIHSGQRYTCYICRKVHTTYQSLRDHKNIHSGAQPYKCDKCKQSFRSAPALRYHKLSHTRVSLLSCDMCGKEFTCKQYLKLHIQSHDNPVALS